jgi:hypothetical protein
MPNLMYTQSIAAGAIFDPLDQWNFQYTDGPGMIKLTHNATAVGLLGTLTAGNVQLMQEAPVPAGGVSGVIPSDLNVPPMIDKVPGKSRLSLRYRNPTGGAIIVNGNIDYQPGGARRGR